VNPFPEAALKLPELFKGFGRGSQRKGLGEDLRCLRSPLQRTRKNSIHPKGTQGEVLSRFFNLPPPPFVQREIGLPLNEIKAVPFGCTVTNKVKVHVFCPARELSLNYSITLFWRTTGKGETKVLLFRLIYLKRVRGGDNG